MNKAARLAVTLAVLGVLTLLSAGSAAATESGRIVEVKRTGDQLNLVFQADGLPDSTTVDPASVAVQVDGADAHVTSAEPVHSTDAVTRVAVLAIDNSRSMSGAKLTAAKSAASTFLSTLSDDVRVGLVTFADSASTAVSPTTDKAKVQDAIDALRLNARIGTALFDGAALAADTTGDLGARSVLLLTDGDEFGNSTTTIDEAIGKATDDDVAVDAVYIGSGTAPPELTSLVTGANGQVVTSDTADLAGVFKSFAQAISSQLLIKVDLPSDSAKSGNVVVTATAGSTPLRDTAFASFVDLGTAPRAAAGPIRVETGSALLPASALPVILGAVFLGLLILLAIALTSIRRDEKQGRVRKRLSLYTLTGRAPVKQEETTTALGSSQVARSAVELAGRMVRKRGFEESLALRLEAGGIPLRAAEWMLIHIGVAIMSALLLMLISGGDIFPTLLGLLAGLALPFAYLIVKESRRTSSFLGQLPDTLQLLAGSLSAGYSMPQAMDTVVREGSQPITSEFNRALVESRLGVPMEDALEGVADRMKSKDFAWVVMAIRIQREVGGNLAELLTTVSGTLRERERLRRQVKVLSAEGRLSAWILGLLPPVFALYLALVRPTYIHPLVSELLGWIMLGIGITLLTVGALWMRKAVKVEV